MNGPTEFSKRSVLIFTEKGKHKIHLINGTDGQTNCIPCTNTARERVVCIGHLQRSNNSTLKVKRGDGSRMLIGWSRALYAASERAQAASAPMGWPPIGSNASMFSLNGPSLLSCVKDFSFSTA